ncbi:hypothetical protein [Sinobaca sp. H24]|uniref:hypothetical protein n=1 Tax=Sinobaca sp. H24 TaxID=2923376 RepID=UPI002079C5CD|nr:hypothetical protein [Sinobaca sp. H24]
MAKTECAICCKEIEVDMDNICNGAGVGEPTCQGADNCGDPEAYKDHMDMIEASEKEIEEDQAAETEEGEE